MEPIVLTLGQKFELERRSRDISAITDVQELRAITKDLLRAWQEEIARSREAVRSACDVEQSRTAETNATEVNLY